MKEVKIPAIKIKDKKKIKDEIKLVYKNIVSQIDF